VTSTPLLRVEDLRVEYDTREGVLTAVDGASFEIADGEIVGIVGESGCGKSTTARGVLNLIESPGRVTGGQVHLRDRGDLTRIRHRELRQVRGADIGYIAQNPFGSLNPILRLEDQFRNVLRAHRGRISRREARELALTRLREVGIAGPERVLDGYAHELSGGMAQRVVIAMAFLLDPRLVIADEPTTGLDVTVQRQILDLIGTLVRSHQRGMVLVTHDLGVVAQYCDRVLVMYAGRVVESGPVREVFRRPAHPYTDALVASIPRPGKELVRLEGTVPSLIDRPSGCAFANRCAFAFEACVVDPHLAPVSTGQLAACHLEDGVTAHVARTA
jgi:peptide/nickel transport system ATP-binding protein